MKTLMLVMGLALLALFPVAMAVMTYIGTHDVYQVAVVTASCVVMSVATSWLFIKAATVQRSELEKRYSLL